MINRPALENDLVQLLMRFDWSEAQARDLAKEMSDQELLEWFEDDGEGE